MTDQPEKTPGAGKKLTPQMRRTRRLRVTLRKVDEALAAQGMADENPARKLIHDVLKRGPQKPATA